MAAEQSIKVPIERIGVLVGKEGVIKAEIERRCGVLLEIDGESGEARISYSIEKLEESNPFKASDIVTAIGRGFSPERAFALLEDDKILTTIDLREYAGKSENAMTRIRSRLIGTEGKARRLIEQLTETQISIYGHTVAIIGDTENSKIAQEAMTKLAAGATHKATFNMLQKYRSKQKMEKLQLWESQKPPEEREY